VTDPVVPLCSEADFMSGAYGDLARQYPDANIVQFLQDATRLCEEACSRRLAPFTVTETVRATGIDPDEYAEGADIPLDIQGTLGMSYASALGGSSLVRKFWLHEYPCRYPDMWSYSNVSVTIIRSYGGTQLLQPGQILDGPDDTGQVRVTLGTYLPVGSSIRVTYSGGYVVATPASLDRACKMMAAGLIVRELDPESTQHDPDQLRADALEILGQWARA
jgi:hypothetical protein